jgi:CheY-like chemotaxis protein
MFQLKADDKHLQLVFYRSPDVPQYVESDELKLRQILINLLNNALKFTDEGGVSVRVSKKSSGRNKQAEGERVEISEQLITTDVPACNNREISQLSQSKKAIFATQKEEAEAASSFFLHFEVEDTGPGIATNELNNLFEAFVQTQTGKDSQEGTGLGLPISRKFVELMGGEMSVGSAVGKGTNFKFDIQVIAVDSADIESPKPTRNVIALELNQPTYRILIVDDKPLNRQLLIKLLNPLGFELKEATNGQEAIEIWDCWEPHLIWMDMRMPVMDGYEATQYIKSTIKGQATAIIALTASVLEEERAVILSAGCDDFMRKPFREADIFDAMHKHIGVRYIYEDRGQANLLAIKEGDRTMTAADFVKLPESLVTHLKLAILNADIDLIDSLIEQIRLKDAVTAGAIANCIENFEYDKVLKLISQAISHE